MQSPEQEEVFMRQISDLGENLAPDVQKMSPDQLANPDIAVGAMRPADIIAPYYGKNFGREIASAANYNESHPSINPSAYAMLFDTIKAVRSSDEQASYSPSLHQVNLESKDSEDIMAYNAAQYRKWLTEDIGQGTRERAQNFFNNNSMDPRRDDGGALDAIEHEYGHHATRVNIGNKLVETARDSGIDASAGNFGSHTSDANETSQALARLQREFFKNTGSRLMNSKQFMDVVNAPDVPEFLTQEGQRILNYSRRLKSVADSDKDQRKRDAAKEALKAISEMAPSFVQNGSGPLAQAKNLA